MFFLNLDILGNEVKIGSTSLSLSTIHDFPIIKMFGKIHILASGNTENSTNFDQKKKITRRIAVRIFISGRK